MSRFAEKLNQLQERKQSENKTQIEAEVIELNQQNDNERIPHDVWLLMQDNGRIATERLNELLTSTRFHRLKAADQAKLIQLAQDRAYGKSDPGIKRIVTGNLSSKVADEIAQSMSKLDQRRMLPEYRDATIDDAELAPDRRDTSKPYGDSR